MSSSIPEGTISKILPCILTSLTASNTLSPECDDRPVAPASRSDARRRVTAPAVILLTLLAVAATRLRGRHSRSAGAACQLQDRRRRSPSRRRGTRPPPSGACGHLRPHAPEVAGRTGMRSPAQAGRRRHRRARRSTCAGTATRPAVNQDYAGMVQDVRAARQFLSLAADVTARRASRLLARRSAPRWRLRPRPTMRRSSASRSCRRRSTIAGCASMQRSRSTAPGRLCSSPATTMAMRCRSVRDLEKAGGGVREVRHPQPCRARHGDAGQAIPTSSRRLLEWFRRTLL